MDATSLSEDPSQDGEDAVRIDMNEMRVGKHQPLERSTSRSVLGLFHFAKARQGLIEELERTNGWKVRDMDWTNELPQIRPSMTPSTRRAAREESEVDVSKRPFYWSHPPEKSLYSRHGTRPGGVGTLTSNKHYRAMPYGVGLSPAAKTAYGAAPRTPMIGHQAAQTMQVDPHLNVLAAELTRRPEFVGGHKASRTLTTFY
jgi:hypothetical protein